MSDVESVVEVDVSEPCEQCPIGSSPRRQPNVWRDGMRVSSPRVSLLLDCGGARSTHSKMRPRRLASLLVGETSSLSQLSIGVNVNEGAKTTSPSVTYGKSALAALGDGVRYDDAVDNGEEEERLLDPEA